MEPRDKFRRDVFDRDKGLCVICSHPGVDAHHIVERRLWPDGGYLLDNGATLCGPCHLMAESTRLSCEEIRAAAKINSIVLPPHLCVDAIYDKWGNEILSNGMRVPGELFDLEPVQKVLKETGFLTLFTDKVKYARTLHLPWSPGLKDPNERMIPSLDRFVKHWQGLTERTEVVVTAKMDGENTTLYQDGLHARSLEYSSHPSRDRLKAFWASIAHDIPKRWRVCVENVYAQHSIGYQNLPAWWLGISIWDDRNICLSWDETLEWFQLLGIKPCPILWRGKFDEDLIKTLWKPELEGDELEGYVVRTVAPFHYREFQHCVAKFVRAGHVQTDKHWLQGPMKVNGIKQD